MGLRLCFRLLGFFFILSGYFLQESAGIGLQTSVASLLPIKSFHSQPHLLHHPSLKAPIIAPYAPSLPSPRARRIRGPLPSPATPSDHLNGCAPIPSPAISPLSFPMARCNEKALPPTPSRTMALRPPPTEDCASLTCTEPLTYSPPGAPCSCVWPIKVKLRFRVSLYSFFPLVSQLAKEIAAAVPLNRSQVRIIGADTADQQLEKTNVLINLVPLDKAFDNATAFSISSKFWKREFSINTSVFGVYEVLDVRYPGLPPSPHSRSAGSATMNIKPYSRGGNNGGPLKPIGVDVSSGRKNGFGKNLAIIVALSSVAAFVVCMGFLLLVLSKCSSYLYRQSQQGFRSPDRKPSGGHKLLTLRSRPSSVSLSFSSSLLACTGTTKVFAIGDIEVATDNFNTSRIIGEGGFGLVFGGILDDGRKVAVKVLKRDDHQGGREFLAEVEMLGRLHHRNLVKLIGICAEDQCRCLVYELVPNGSVESHLHGADKETAPLDWCSRMKIAVGTARGLAYLHEDSSPRVIHRDFKSSNILLEHDYTPKVSDFGLARAATDEGNKHISTHVMGTFGYALTSFNNYRPSSYVAPEYAMTGHLLVKSDVYSYGVVLLELLTGKKPVDLSQPPGQENLVSWARPLLATKQGLEIVIDPSLKPNVSLDNFSKVAAIASMCVQPDVSHRPFMGEVIQALKLVCHEFDEPCSGQEEFFVDVESRISLDEVMEEASEECDSCYYDDDKVAFSSVDMTSVSVGLEGKESESFRRQFNSAPLKMGRKRTFWERLRGHPGGSMSEHERSAKL
ncbi:hypothetical protein OROHE_003937 [Orobanche hederae]